MDRAPGTTATNPWSGTDSNVEERLQLSMKNVADSNAEERSSFRFATLVGRVVESAVELENIPCVGTRAAFIRAACWSMLKEIQDGRSQYCQTGIHADYNEREGRKDPPRSLYKWQCRHLAILGSYGSSV